MTYITIIYDFNLQLIIYVTSMRFLFLLLTSCFYSPLLLLFRGFTVTVCRFSWSSLSRFATWPRQLTT